VILECKESLIKRPEQDSTVPRTISTVRQRRLASIFTITDILLCTLRSGLNQGLLKPVNPVIQGGAEPLNYRNCYQAAVPGLVICANFKGQRAA